MREQLLIFYNPGQTSIEAQLLDSEGQAAASTWRGKLEDLAPLAEGRRLQVIVPTESVVMHSAELPMMRGNKALNAVPYILEDQLLEDVDSLHFALAGSGGKVDVATVAHDNMREWTEEFKRHDIHPQVMVPDALTLPLHEHSWTIWLEDNRVLVRSGQHQGWACRLLYLPVLLQQALKQDQEAQPQQWQIYDYRQGDSSSLESLLQAVAGEIELVFHERVDKPQLLMATNLLQDSPLNLLQGAYRYKQQIGKLLRPWRYSLYGAAALILIAMLNSVIGYIGLMLDKSRIESQIEATVQQYFPAIKTINFYQLEGRIKRETAQVQKEGVKEGYFYMVQSVGRILQSYPDMQLQQLNYQGNQLELHVKSEQPTRVDELVGRLRTSASMKVDVNMRDGVAVIKVRG